MDDTSTCNPNDLCAVFLSPENPSSPPPSLLSLQQQQHQVMSSKYDPRLGSGLHVGDMAPSIPGAGGLYSSSSSSSSSSNSLPDSVDYKTNPYVKPPYSYASLICMAMKATRKNKITLSSIYNWITDNFMYYRLTDPSWQVNMRSWFNIARVIMYISLLIPL